jgi:hypothetical protein
MSQGIQDFYNTAQALGFSRDNQLRVMQIGDLFEAPNENLYIYARTAKVPSRTIKTSDVYCRGFKFSTPTQVEYEGGTWPLTILCDESYIIRSKIETWQKRVYNEHTMTGVLENSVIQLNLLNDALDTVMIYRLHGCIPQKIGELQYDLAGDGKPLSFELNIAYQYWTSEIVSFRAKEDEDFLTRAAGVLRRIGQIGQRVNNGVRSVRNFGSILSN